MVGVIVAGLATRAFPALVPRALGKYPGDALWAIMVFVALGALIPRLATVALATLTLGVCFGVETLKLVPFAWLAALRHTTLGHLVLGHTFTWQNYFVYAAGVSLACLAEGGTALRHRSDEPRR